MTLNEWICLAVLTAAGVLVSYGCYLLAEPAGFIVGGVWVAALGVLFALDVRGPDK